MPESNLQQDRLVETKVFAIEGMTCDHCLKKVEKIIRGQKGVSDVRVDRQAGRATVTCDTRQTDIPQMHDALRKAGYGVVPAGN